METGSRRTEWEVGSSDGFCKMEGEGIAPKAQDTALATEAQAKDTSADCVSEPQTGSPEKERIQVEDDAKPEAQPMDIDKTSDTTEKLEEDVPMAEEAENQAPTQAERDRNVLEESKSTPLVAASEESKAVSAAIHHPLSAGSPCVVDRHISADGKKVPIDTLKLAVSQLRNEGRSWTQTLAIVFGYRYDEEWRLRKVSKDEGFTFIEQKHYELLGDVILSYVQEVMRVKYRQREIWIPENVQDGPKCNIFVSEDFETNRERCLLLIQGAGAVRAGQWARSVCINAKLTEGTVFPALDYAQSHGFSTIIFNPNMNYEQNQPILGSNSMETHSKFVWKHYIRKCPAQTLFIIAHSCGGMCTTEILSAFEDEFIERVKAVAFTDSVHGGVRGKAAQAHLERVAVDFVASGLPLKAPVRSVHSSYNSCVCVSSGHQKHEYTTGSAMPAIVEFFDHMLSTRKNMFLDS